MVFLCGNGTTGKTDSRKFKQSFVRRLYCKQGIGKWKPLNAKVIHIRYKKASVCINHCITRCIQLFSTRTRTATSCNHRSFLAAYPPLLNTIGRTTFCYVHYLMIVYKYIHGSNQLVAVASLSVSTGNSNPVFGIWCPLLNAVVLRICDVQVTCRICKYSQRCIQLCGVAACKLATSNRCTCNGIGTPFLYPWVQRIGNKNVIIRIYKHTRRIRQLIWSAPPTITTRNRGTGCISWHPALNTVIVRICYVYNTSAVYIHCRRIF